jgi:murein L,D-transpeptidase YcbB/YkuD
MNFGRKTMRGLSYHRILAGTALALILAAPSAAYAQTPPALEAAVPMPDAATVPPPTAADMAAKPAAAAAPVANTVNESAPETAATTTGTVPAAPAAEAAKPADTPPDTPADTAAKPAATLSETAAKPAETPADTAAVAPAEVAPPDPFASLDPADRPIAEKVRDLLASKTDKTFTNKKERAAVEAFYQTRTMAPVWFDKGVENARAKTAIARLKAADAEGLDPRDYKIPDLTAANPDAIAEAELKLTAAVLTYARHLQAGRFSYAAISKNIEMPQQPPETAAVLAKIVGSDAGKALDTFSPPHQGYKKLKALLAELRHKAGGGTVQIPDGPTLKLTKNTMEDSRVAQLRERLGVTGDSTDLRYDSKVADAVKKFQRSHDLNVNGTLDARTIRTLNGPTRDRQIDVILANMERWRWLPRDLGNAHVVVNIPEYQLRVFKDGAQVWTTRIVVGKPNLQTPILAASMKYITVNPTWNVPPSIVQNEYLPALAQDPTVLSRMGLRVEHNRDGSIHISQPPGDGNALGRVRFNFPNKFLVYQHDTPDKHLFAHDSRAYSHGCMRVQDPPKYAEVLLNIVRPSEGWTADKIHRMYGSSERDIQFPTHIPVYLTYQTAYVDDAGKLQTRPDIYSIDNRVIAAIKNERGMIEMAQERPAERVSSNSRRSRAPERRAVADTRSNVSFFESLFGGGSNSRPVPPRRVR